jgi:ribosomal protein S18 acetylase RimI-like enzyme
VDRREVAVRPASPEDLPAVARVRAASWREAYAGLVPDDELERMGEPASLETWAARMAASSASGGSGTLVALVDGRIVGFSAYGDERSDLVPAVGGRGEIYALYVHPDAWGAGAGHALMTATIAALRARGHDALSLWVLEENARGVAFYRRQGCAPTGEVTASRIDGLRQARWTRSI